MGIVHIKGRTKHNAAKEERRQRLRAKGLCLSCGKNPAQPSKRSPSGIGINCVECAKTASDCQTKYLARRVPAWKKLGLCYVCGTRRAMVKDGLCGVCAERRCEWMDNFRKRERDMKLHLIHEGGFYMGTSGQVRHALRIVGEWVTYEVVDRGIVTPNHTATPPLGESRRAKVTTLAAWAIREVPDPATHGPHPDAPKDDRFYVPGCYLLPVRPRRVSIDDCLSNKPRGAS